VCARHFDIGDDQQRGSPDKVPIRHIGRSEAEIAQILAVRVSSVIAGNVSARFDSQPDDEMATDHLSNGVGASGEFFAFIIFV
jgi:hypothetical protein